MSRHILKELIVVNFLDKLLLLHSNNMTDRLTTDFKIKNYNNRTFDSFKDPPKFTESEQMHFFLSYVIDLKVPSPNLRRRQPLPYYPERFST